MGARLVFLATPGVVPGVPEGAGPGFTALIMSPCSAMRYPATFENFTAHAGLDSTARVCGQRSSPERRNFPTITVAPRHQLNKARG